MAIVSVPQRCYVCGKRRVLSYGWCQPCRIEQPEEYARDIPVYVREKR
jgi:hypothetical protein